MEPYFPRRLEALLALLDPCDTLVDVGTDHGLLPLAAVARGRASRAIGIDRKRPPLEGAEKNRMNARLEARVEFRLGDGLAAMSAGEGEALAIAGMGGRLAVRILEAAPAKTASFRQLLVQPNQEADAVRSWALRSGWHLVAEDMVEERGLFFPVLKWIPGHGPDPAYQGLPFDEAELVMLGPWLWRAQAEAARRYWELQRQRVSRLDGHKNPHSAVLTDLYTRALV